MNEDESLQINNKLQERIKVYRERFDIDPEVPDKKVIELIKNFRWLAKLYIREFKSKNPDELLQKHKLSYNENADNSSTEVH
jgi:hypothetical protein